MKEGEEKMLNRVRDPGGWGSNNKVWRAHRQVQRRKGESRKLQVLLSKELRNMIMTTFKVLDPL